MSVISVSSSASIVYADNLAKVILTNYGPAGADGADGSDGADGADAGPWDTNTTYDAGAIVSQTKSGTRYTFISKSGSNTGNSPASDDGTWWQQGASIDHGQMSGLSDDDHTQYVLADGTRTLTDGTLTRPTATGTVENQTALTSATTVDIDFDLGPQHVLAAQAHGVTLTTSNAGAGKSATVLLTQDGTGSRTLTVPVAWKWLGGEPTWTSTAGETNGIELVVDSDGTTIYASGGAEA